MQQHLFGILAILFLAAAAAIFLRGGDDSEFLLSVCLRVGMVLAAIWLAYRQVEQIAQRVPTWMVVAIGATLLLIAVRPRLFWLMIPVLIAIGALQFVGWLFKPLPNSKRSARPAPANKLKK